MIIPAAPKIAIAGQVGSGKSTVSRLVAAATGWERFSTGELFRRIAATRGMTPLELNVFARNHAEIDDEVDGRLAALADDPDPTVIDSRMAWHFVPAAFKVYLTVDPRVGAQRIFAAARADERYASIEEAAAKAAAREQEETARYGLLYGVNPPHWRNYDLVVDTTHCPPETVVERILQALAAPDDPHHAPNPRCLLAPRRLLPSAGAITDDASTVGVAVAGGYVIIVAGHSAVGAALAAGSPLVASRLEAFESEAIGPHSSVLVWAESTVTAPGIAKWETRHGFRFASVPPWLA
jgi:cytidylate kinase